MGKLGAFCGIAVLSLALGACTMTTQMGGGPEKTRAFLATPPAPGPAWSIAIHGGAGVIERKDLTPEQDKAYRAALAEAIEIGASILRKGGDGIDAVDHCSTCCC